MSLRVVMMGTGEFAVPVLRALVESPHQVVALVTQPPRPQGRKKLLLPSPTAQVAQECSVPVLTPQRINAPESVTQLAQLEPEVLVVADYGQILSAQVLSVPRLGGLNVHASLLPKYRGAAPGNWAIYHGEPYTGVSIIRMTPHLDAGPLLAQEKLAIDPEETAPELEARLAQLAARMIVPVLERWAEGHLPEVPQDDRQATRAPRLKKTDGLVHWHRTAQEIKNQIRAMQPWPRAYSWLLRGGAEPLRLILHRARVAHAASEGPPGTVLSVPELAAPQERLLVATGGPQALEILELQPQGRRVMSAQEFLRGYRVAVGDRLGRADSQPN